MAELTDEQWIKQNKGLGPDEARAQGLCWHCGGNKILYWAFGGEQGQTVCPECKGTGKART